MTALNALTIAPPYAVEKALKQLRKAKRLRCPASVAAHGPRQAATMTSESGWWTSQDATCLLVKRFDHEKLPDGYLRARMVSALTLLQAEDTYQSRWRLG